MLVPWIVVIVVGYIRITMVMQECYHHFAIISMTAAALSTRILESWIQSGSDKETIELRAISSRTPPKIHMEPENNGLEDDFPLPVVYLQSPECILYLIENPKGVVYQSVAGPIETNNTAFNGIPSFPWVVNIKVHAKMRVLHSTTIPCDLEDSGAL